MPDTLPNSRVIRCTQRPGKLDSKGLAAVDQLLLILPERIPLSFSIAEEAYGPALEAKRPHGTFLAYVARDSTCWLQFSVRENVVQSIGVECQP